MAGSGFRRSGIGSRTRRRGRHSEGWVSRAGDQNARTRRSGGRCGAVGADPRRGRCPRSSRDQCLGYRRTAAAWSSPKQRPSCGSITGPSHLARIFELHAREPKKARAPVERDADAYDTLFSVPVCRRVPGEAQLRTSSAALLLRTKSELTPESARDSSSRWSTDEAMRTALISNRRNLAASDRERRAARHRSNHEAPRALIRSFGDDCGDVPVRERRKRIDDGC